MVWVILLRLSLVLSNNRTYHSKMASRLVSFFALLLYRNKVVSLIPWRPLELHVLTSPALMNNFYLFSPSNVPRFSLLWTCNTTLQGHQASLIYSLRTVNCLGICKWVFTLFAHIHCEEHWWKVTLGMLWNDKPTSQDLFSGPHVGTMGTQQHMTSSLSFT